MTKAKVAKYPVQLSIDYPKQELDRLSTFLRVFYIIPIAIIGGLLMGGSKGAGGLIVVPTLLMIVFMQKYPKWWYEWNLQLAQFISRIAAYALLLSDEYPSTDQEQYVHVSMLYPNVKKDLNRWMPLVKWLLAIPHYIVLLFLGAAAVVVAIIAWFAILFTGSYPRQLFAFVTGVMRWNLRVIGYAGLMITDQYPPFSLEE